MTPTELLAGLNPSQAQAVQHIDGPLLMLAGPGSGKTRVITHRVAHMLQQGIAPQSIIALTFTNKAAGEMQARLQKLVGHSDVWMGTFHGFCVRLLRRYARLAGLPENFSIYDVDDAAAALKAAVAEAAFELTHVSIGTLANRISYFKNRLVTPEVLEAETLSSDEYQVGQVYPHYQKQLLKNGAVDFDDILMHTAILLRSYPELRQQLDERFKYVMVDEYQDTNLAQYVIVRHLCVDYPNLAATGDPDQSIYGWRGANLKNVAYLERDYPDLQVIRLEENYRSTPEILSIADSLIQNNEFRKPKALVPSRGHGHSVRLAIYPTANQEAEDVADQIASQQAAGDYQFSDFGILVRTNAHSRSIERACLRRQIPYQLIGGFRFYLRKEIKDLISYLLLVNNPDDGVALQRAINIPPRGIGKQTIAKLESHARATKQPVLEACRAAVSGSILSARATSAIKGFLKVYDGLCAIAHGPLLDLLQSAIEQTKYREYLLKQNRGEEEADVMRNLDELLAEAMELDNEPDERPALERFLEVAALQSDTDRLESDRNQVTVMTLHAAKGLEFPCVFIIAVEENVLPHSRSKDDPLQLEEERRLLFVGITRAKDQLQLSYAKSRGFSSQGSGIPSSFLMELPRHDMQIIDRTESLSDYYDDGSEGFDQYFDNDHGADSWDEACQLDGDADTHASDFEFDDECQLPPEELKQRLQKSMKHKTAGRGLVLGSQIPADALPGLAKWAAYKVGKLVTHEKFGQGEIISASGHGPKRAVSVNFFGDGSRRTFRLSHVDLKLEGLSQADT
ncbi:MAG: UvrD-helicase domain-containing protein [Pirellulaceae bacterium]